MSVGGYIVAYMILLGCAAICVLKGKRGLLAVGVVLPFVWALGIVVAAKPESLWEWTFGDDAAIAAGQRGYVAPLARACVWYRSAAGLGGNARRG